MGQASAQKAEAGESGAWASEALSQKKQKTKPKNNNNNKKFNILKFATQWRKKNPYVIILLNILFILFSCISFKISFIFQVLHKHDLKHENKILEEKYPISLFPRPLSRLQCQFHCYENVLKILNF